MQVLKLREYARLPEYGSKGAGAFDIFSPVRVTVPANARGVKVPLGIAVELLPGECMLLLPRSSTGTKTPLRMSNSVGLIDSDYRGEIAMTFDNLSTEDFEIHIGDRLVQGLVISPLKQQFIKVDSLSETERGNKGFGSTGI